ncbi:MAG: DHH family phosphoesterase [Armatimonadota bacterium]
MNKSDLEAAARVIHDGGSFLVMGHISPDGDSLGCVCALTLAFEQMQKEVIAVSPDGVPDLYKYLPGSDRIIQSAPEDRSFDACIVVDCENLDRLGPAKKHLSSCSVIIEADHHPGSERTDGINLLEPRSASSGEIVYALLKELGVHVTVEMAEALLTAIVTDTGSFRFSNVKPDTLRSAADLLEAGASTSKIAQRVYDTRSYSSMKLLGFALNNLRLMSNGRVAYSFISRENISDSSAADGETEGIVNYMRSVRGVKAGILFSEGTDGTTRVSFRAKEGVDVSRVARQFGGGGHKAAAGATINLPLDQAVKIVLDAVEKWMESLT